MPIKFTITRKTGNRAEGILSWPEKNLRSAALSGPYENGPIEAGLYRARRNVLLDKPGEAPYCDPANNCWFQLLDPQFSTTRTEIGIHPDGGVTGTKGCIGIQTNNTKNWYDALYSVPINTYTLVEVVDETVFV